MTSEPESADASPSNAAASADAHQDAAQAIEERARVAGRTLSRSWLWRLAAVAAGLIAARLASRRRTARRAAAR
jgi:hypothetical protein